MTASKDTIGTDAVPLPVEMELGHGQMVAGLFLPGEGRLTILLLHDEGADLDAVRTLMEGLGLPEMHKLAVDLPGHGLSSEVPDGIGAADWLARLGTAMENRGWAPVLVVGCGRAAGYAWQLGQHKAVAGICLVSPLLQDRPLEREPLIRLPVQVFLPSASPEVKSAWLEYRSCLRAPWLAVSMQMAHETLVALDEGCRQQVASHLQGFARDLLLQNFQRE